MNYDGLQGALSAAVGLSLAGIVSVTTPGANQALVAFSEPVDPVSSQVAANYRIGDSGGSVLVTSAVLEPDDRTVLLTTSTPLQGTSGDTLTVSNVETAALSALPVIATNFTYASSSGFVAPTFTIGVNTLSTDNASPALTGTVSDPEAEVMVRVNGSYYAATNNGDGTWSLPQGEIAPLGNGVYNVVAAGVNTSGVEAFDTTVNQLTVSTTSPTVGIASPASPTFSPPGSIAITFSEPIENFTLQDLQLTLANGGPAASEPLEGATLTSTDNQHWTLGDLSGLTAAAGTYSLTVVGLGSAVSDTFGNPLLSSLTASWTLGNPAVPPVVTIGNFGATTFICGGTAVAVAPHLIVSDAGSANLLWATVSISGGPLDTGNEILAANTAGTAITAAYNSTSGVLTLSGSDTLANYQQVLQSVTYVDTLATTTNTGNRTLRFSVSDASNSSVLVNAAVAFDVAPQVVGVYVSGSAWSASYYTTLANAGVGSSLGYELASGAGQLANAYIPGWVNLDTLSIVFSKPVSGVTLSSLSLGDSSDNGGPASGISVTGETNPNSTVATFSLNGALPSNKYYLDLAAAGISDAAGAALDGVWTTGASTFAAGSGNGVPGSDFIFRFNVLAGDVNGNGQVDADDINAMRSQPLAMDNAGNWRYDVNGDGKVSAGDVNAIRSQPTVSIDSFPEPLLPALNNPSSSLPTVGAWASNAFGPADIPGTPVTVVFNSPGGGTVNLDGANPCVGNVTFNSLGSYTIAQGSGGTLQFDGGAGPAMLAAVAGSHTISAPVALQSNLLVSPAAGSQVTISGDISGAGESLTVDDQGTVVLEGANSYSGGTAVSAGTLVVAASSAISAGTSLTVGAGATLIFDPSFGATPSAVMASAALVAAASAPVAAAVGNASVQSPPIIASAMNNNPNPTPESAAAIAPAAIPEVMAQTESWRWSVWPIAPRGSSGPAESAPTSSPAKDKAVRDAAFAVFGACGPSANTVSNLPPIVQLDP